MKKVIRLTENELIDLVKRVVYEQSQKPSIEGRTYTVNNDHTISINDKNGTPQKIKMSGSKAFLDFDINVTSISPKQNGYDIITKKGNKYTLDKNIASQIISFVDKSSPSKIDAGQATINLTKV